MKHFYKPIILLASFISLGKYSEAKISTDKLSLSFGGGSVAFKDNQHDKKNTKLVDNKLLELDTKQLRKTDEMSFYPSNGLALKVLLRTVSKTSNRFPTAIASLDGATEIGSLKTDNKGIVIENFTATCVEKKQYLFTWQSTTQNKNGHFTINYLNAKGKLQTVYEALPQAGVKNNYTAFVTLPDVIDKPTFNLIFEDLSKQSVSLANTTINADADGEMVDIIAHQEESALFVKTIAGTGGTYKLDVFDESGKLIISNEEVEIMAGSSQIIPMDLPQAEHGTYLAVLSNSGSKKKKKTFKIAH